MKHQFYEVIVGWAEGQPIQFSFYRDSDKTWYNYRKDECPDFNDSDVKWRLKPEAKTGKYRVALFKEPKEGFYYTKNDDGYGNEDFENSIRFVKWLTDWIEYELE
jgi:hypothetical protein